MKPVKLKNLQLYYKGSVEPEFNFSNAHEALLCLIYLKTGLIFLKPDNENHILFPDNLREYHNIMQLLKNMDSVVDETGKIVAEKVLLRKNLDQFKHYFFDSWVKQNLEQSLQADLKQFMDEPVESKNKLIYFKLMQYVEAVKKNIPESIEDNKSESTDNYRIKRDTPSYNVSLANVFEALNQLDLQKEYKNMVGAVGVAYSIIAFELMYFSNNLHKLYNGKVFEFSYVENRTYHLYKKSNEKTRGIELRLQNLLVKVSNEKVSLMELNNAIKKILKNWEKESSIQISDADALKVAQILSLIFVYLFIYNGYYAEVSDDGTTLGKKFYERAVYFKQGRYSLAPSGFFFKVLNLKRVLELTLLEKLDNSIGIDENGEISFKNNEEILLNEEKNHWLLDKETDEWLFKSEEKLLKLKEIAKTSFEKDFIGAWIKLLKANALDENPIEILPYCSFEVIKFISDEQVLRSVSKYRKGEQDSIRLFTHVDTQNKKSTTGFSNDFNRILLDLKEKMSFSFPCKFDQLGASKSGNQIMFESPLSYYYMQFENIRFIFDLFKYYEFNIIDKNSNSENSDYIKESDNTIKSFDKQITLKEVHEIIVNFYKKNEEKTKFYPDTKNELKNIKNEMLNSLKQIKRSKGDRSGEIEQLEKLIERFGNDESAKKAIESIKIVLDYFEDIIKLYNEEEELNTRISKINSSTEV